MQSRDLRDANQRFNEYLRAMGYQPTGGEAKDGDGWASWRNRTDQLFAALFPPGLDESLSPVEVNSTYERMQTWLIPR